MLPRVSALGQLFLVFASITAAALATAVQADETPASGDTRLLLDAVPARYTLHAYDDCGSRRLVGVPRVSQIRCQSRGNRLLAERAVAQAQRESLH